MTKVHRLGTTKIEGPVCTLLFLPKSNYFSLLSGQTGLSIIAVIYLSGRRSLRRRLALHTNFPNQQQSFYLPLTTSIPWFCQSLLRWLPPWLPPTMFHKRATPQTLLPSASTNIRSIQMQKKRINKSTPGLEILYTTILFQTKHTLGSELFHTKISIVSLMT